MVEYLFIGNTAVFPVRAGLFYDPEPAEKSPDDFYGFSYGFRPGRCAHQAIA